MEFLIVADADLTRPGARLHAVLERVGRGALLSTEQFAQSSAPGPEVRVVFLGEVPEARSLRESSAPLFNRHGITFGTRGHQAWIHGGQVDDPTGTLRAMGADLEELQDVAGVELLALDTTGNTEFHGIHLAGLYLDPYLKVPAQTEVERRVSFSPARMCWERQYTLGIASFLRDAWEDFASSSTRH